MLYLLFSPLSYLVVAAGLAAGLAAAVALSPRRRAPRWLGTVLAAVGLASLVPMTPWGANLLVHALESQVPPVTGECLAKPPTTIVVLGGGFDRAPRDADDTEALTAPSLRRVLAAVRLWQAQPAARLVIAGGGGPFAVAESSAMGRLALQMGVPAAQLQLETRSTSTYENLAQLATLQPPVERRIWLLSSALHLPRAMAVAARAGFSACAQATDFMYVPPGGLGYYLPQTSALAKSEAALHEIVGSWVYAWR